MLATALSSSNDPFTCQINDPGNFEDHRYWMECADIASATTLSEAISPVAVNSSDPYIGSLENIELNYSSVNRFGGAHKCVASFSEDGENARVGDGVIDAFDISALLW